MCLNRTQYLVSCSRDNCYRIEQFLHQHNKFIYTISILITYEALLIQSRTNRGRDESKRCNYAIKRVHNVWRWNGSSAANQKGFSATETGTQEADVSGSVVSWLRRCAATCMEWLTSKTWFLTTNLKLLLNFTYFLSNFRHFFNLWWLNFDFSIDWYLYIYINAYMWNSNGQVYLL